MDGRKKSLKFYLFIITSKNTRALQRDLESKTRLLVAREDLRLIIMLCFSIDLKILFQSHYLNSYMI
jgi:hypothetical protein